MKLLENAKHLWKSYTVWVNSIFALILMNKDYIVLFWSGLGEIKADMPRWVQVAAVVIIAGLSTWAARSVAQKSIPPEAPKQELT